MWGKKIVFYDVYLDRMEKAGPKTGNMALKVLPLSFDEGMKSAVSTPETPALLCLSSLSPLTPVSSLPDPWQLNQQQTLTGIGSGMGP